VVMVCQRTSCFYGFITFAVNRTRDKRCLIGR
jgi:hypothetical protein